MMTGGFENSGVKIFSPGNNGNQFADIAQPLRRHEPELRQMRSNYLSHDD